MKTVDYCALENNVKFFRRLIGRAKLFAVLKNDAYGHGLVRVASHIVSLVDMFAVGSVDEAEQIQFLRKDILVLLPPKERDVARAISSDFILTLDSVETLKMIDGVAKTLKKPARVHVKIDSGMSRLGFDTHKIDKLLKMLETASVNVEGVFSHFYGDARETCDEQLTRFMFALPKLKKVYPDIICHIANTSATLLSSKYRLDAVRIGLGLFGYGDERLTPVKTVFADIIATRDVPAHCAVGYGAVYRPKKPTRLAVLRVGYANGLPRTLIGSRVSINGRLFPIVAVCMAMTIVDVENAEVNVGDKACLLGKGVNLANDDVIVYELLCNLQ